MKAKRQVSKTDVGSPHRKTSHGEGRSANGMTLWVPALLIVLMTFWVYAPAIRGEWLWDDKELISQNEVILDPHGLWRIWSDPGSLVDYYPVLSSVEWCEWRLFHQQTAGYHLVNIALHLLSAFLVWRLLAKFGLRLAWLGGLIFALHPVQVESVAWVAELKNTLSLPFFLLAMCAYVDFDENRKRRDYFWALGLFVVAMLCKTTVIMFPVVILLYAGWNRGRIRSADLKASAAFFAVSLVLGWVTLWFQQHHAINGHEIEVGGFPARIALAGTSILFYFLNCVWPAGLLPIYPKWTINPPGAFQFLPWLALAGVSFVGWLKWATWGRHALLGLGFFVINLLPFVGWSTANFMSFSWVVDHVLYVPLIGLVGLLTAALDLAYENSGAMRPVVVAFMTAILAGLAWESHEYAGKFINQHTLWTYTLEHNPEAWPAHNNLGNYLLSIGHTEEAIDHFKQALRIDPQLPSVHNNLGNAYQSQKLYPQAIEQYQIALNIDAGYEQAHQAMALALSRIGKISEALEHYRLALEINPNDTKTRMDYADLLLQSGRATEAAEQYERALRHDPHHMSYRENLKESNPAKN
jgi:Tfp pilus assembly protein PilF